MKSTVEIFGVATRVRDPKALVEGVRASARSRGWALLVDAGHVLGRDHLLSAVEHAERAFNQGRNSTSSVDLETLLYASGERQISRALETMGIKEGQPFVAVVAGVSPEDLLQEFGWERDDRLVAATSAKMKAFPFTQEEIESAGPSPFDLVLERVARVDLEK